MTRMREERGNVLATAMLLIAVMMMIGLATIATADTQSGQSRKERERESTFNLTEAVLNSQTYVLGRNGTGTSSAAFPNACEYDPANNKTPTSSLCPSPAELSRSFDGATQADFKAGMTWTTAVRDNQAPGQSTSDYYDPSLTGSDCGATNAAANNIYCYDQNGDNKLWVRASSTVRGKTRTIVALIQVELRSVSFPQYSILAGSFETTNNGRKTIVDTSPSYLAVRCTGTAGTSSNCLNYDPSKAQVQPDASVLTGQPNQPAVTSDDLLSLEDSARAKGTYYATCPANPSGKIVYVKSGNCSYNNSVPGACCNTAASPGLFIIENGTLSLNGNLSFYGVIYAVNAQNTNGTVVTTGGTSYVQGGVIVDGLGKVSAGSSGLNVKFDPNAFTGITSTGTAGVVQNTWRELPAD